MFDWGSTALLKQIRAARGMLADPVVRVPSNEQADALQSHGECSMRSKVREDRRIKEGANQHDLLVQSGVKRQHIGNLDSYLPEMVRDSKCFRSSFRTVQRQLPSSDDDGSSSAESGLYEKHEAELADLLRDSAPDSTLLQDTSHVRTWSAAGKVTGMRPLRLNP